MKTPGHGYARQPWAFKGSVFLPMRSAAASKQAVAPIRENGAMTMSHTIEAREIFAAAQRLNGQVVRTPLLRSAALDALTGGRILLKAENLQIGGAFKFRGAYNRLVQLDA